MNTTLAGAKGDIHEVALDRLWVAAHEHDNGTDFWLFHWEGQGAPSGYDDEMAEMLGIDYEPKRGETLTVAPVVKR